MHDLSDHKKVSMLKGTVQFRVIYGDTDKMGYLYYGHYAKLYEIGRAELMRETGVTYQECEDIHGVMMPVLHLECRYKLPAKYDQLLTIHTELRELPRRMLHFHHEIYNEEGDLLNLGEVKLFYVDMKTNKNISCPPFLMDKFKPHY